jgi:DNA-binding protein HU-beta
MNKADLIERVATEADLSKASATRAIDAFLNGISIALKKGEGATLVGFGSFYLGERKERTGRNPKNQATIKIKAAKVPKFRAGKALKDMVN